jgi:hypothetical protein
MGVISGVVDPATIMAIEKLMSLKWSNKAEEN